MSGDLRRTAWWKDPVLWSIFGLSFVYDIFVSSTLGPLSADETHNGLAAFQILDGQRILFAGHNYLGSLPAYLNAPLIGLFGPENWIPRFFNLIFRRGDLLLVFGILRLSMGRWAGLAGLLLFAFPAHGIVGNLLLGTNYGLAAFLWLSAIFLLALAIRYPSESRGCGIGIGLACGLALWTTPLSVVAAGPLLVFYVLLAPLPEALWKRTALVFGSGLAASLPWWHYNLVTTWLGSLRQEIAMLPPVHGLGGRLAAAFHNWGFYLTRVFPEYALSSRMGLGNVLDIVLNGCRTGVALLCVVFPIALAVALVRAHGSPLRHVRLWLSGQGLAGATTGGEDGREASRGALHWERGHREARPHGGEAGKETSDQPADGEKGLSQAAEAPLAESAVVGLFWWGAILGIVAAWTLAIGFSYPGGIRGQVVRYALPLFCLLPLMAVRGIWALPRGRMLALSLTALLFSAPALVEIVNSGAIAESSRQADQRVSAILERIEAHHPTYIAGDYWDVFSYTYWTDRRVIGIALKDDLTLQEGLPFQQWRPQSGEGFLLLREGSEMAAHLDDRTSGDPLPRLAAPAGFTLYRIPFFRAAGVLPGRSTSVTIPLR